MIGTREVSCAMISEEALPEHIKAFSENELRAMAAQDFPNIYLGGVYNYADLIHYAAQRAVNR